LVMIVSFAPAALRSAKNPRSSSTRSGPAKVRERCHDAGRS